MADLLPIIDFILQKGFPAAVLIAVVVTYQRQQTQSDAMFAYLEKQIEAYRALLADCVTGKSDRSDIPPK
jgi:hypothetical protein